MRDFIFHTATSFVLFSLILSLFFSFPELTDHSIKIPTEMMQNLMILHSYILVKVCSSDGFLVSKENVVLRLCESKTKIWCYRTS